MINSSIASYKGRPVRVLHCPWNIAGQSAALSAAERELGADSRCIVLHETGIGFKADEHLTKSANGLIANELARYRLLWRAMVWADVVHFSFGQSCLVPNAYPGFGDVDWKNPFAVLRRAYARAIWLKDLPLLAAMGKTLVVTWQGDDARQHDRSLELFDVSIARELGDAYYPSGSDTWKRRSIRVFDRHVKLHYALNPDLMHVLPPHAQHLPYASFDPLSVVSCPPDSSRLGPVRLVHAPSHRGAKGTHYILAAVERLKTEGLEFDFELIEGLSRDDAIQRYAACDVVVDQLLVGWYGGLGVEAMALGKPVIAFIREKDLVYVAPQLKLALPVISAAPDSIEAVLRQVIAMPRAELQARGEASRAFAVRFDNPNEVAKRTLADYQMARTSRV
jgi:hypothetical protein